MPGAPYSSFSTFGELLKHLRLRAGLTQDEFGLAVGYSRAHVARLESGQRLPDLAMVTSVLAPALHLEGEPDLAARLVELASVARGESPPLVSPVARTTGDLPAPLTHFVGRTRELAEVWRLLASDGTRLLTLTGSGGAGKTRLAQQVAADMLSRFADGGRYVELATLSDPTLLAGAVASAIGLAVTERSAFDQLTDFLGDRHMLLVLDNCEHLIDAVATFTVELLRACPRVSILTTSREALNVEGEVTWRVPPMQPDEAAQVFVERACAVRLDLMLDAQDTTVAHICTRLDRMPLGIELAAARLQGMSLNELSAGLDNRFALLSSSRRGALPRQQTLRATIDWSHDLLSEPERTLFRRLAVFVGGRAAELAEQVCADGTLLASSVLSLLLSLVGKSLVVAEEREGETRYHYLETIREYARQKLAEHGELEMMQRQHAEAFAALAEQSHDPSRGPQQRWWMARLARDAITEQTPPRICGHVWLIYLTTYQTYTTHEAMLSDWERALDCYTKAGHGSGVADVMENIGRWLVHIDMSNPQGWRMLEESIVLARATGDTLVEHRGLLMLGEFAQRSKEFERAQAFYEETIRLCRETGDLNSLSRALSMLARLYYDRQQFHEALTYAEEAVEVGRQLNDYKSEITGKELISESSRFLGDLPRAVDSAEHSLALVREHFTEDLHVTPLVVLSKALIVKGEYARAQTLLDKALRIDQRLWPAPPMGAYSPVYRAMACAAACQGQARRAALLFGAADAEIQLVKGGRPPVSSGNMIHLSPWHVRQ